MYSISTQMGKAHRLIHVFYDKNCKKKIVVNGKKLKIPVLSYPVDNSLYQLYILEIN